MSLILDALRRSESERAAEGGVPGIGTEQQPAVGTGERYGNRSLMMLAAALVAILAGLGLWLYSDMNQQPTAAAAPNTARLPDTSSVTNTPVMPASSAAEADASADTLLAPEAVSGTAVRASLRQQAGPQEIRIAPINSPLAATTASATVKPVVRQLLLSRRRLLISRPLPLSLRGNWRPSKPSLLPPKAM